MSNQTSVLALPRYKWNEVLDAILAEQVELSHSYEPLGVEATVANKLRKYHFVYRPQVAQIGEWRFGFFPREADDHRDVYFVMVPLKGDLGLIVNLHLVFQGRVTRFYFRTPKGKTGEAVFSRPDFYHVYDRQKEVISLLLSSTQNANSTFELAESSIGRKHNKYKSKHRSNVLLYENRDWDVAMQPSSLTLSLYFSGFEGFKQLWRRFISESGNPHRMWIEIDFNNPLPVIICDRLKAFDLEENAAKAIDIHGQKSRL